MTKALIQKELLRDQNDEKAAAAARCIAVTVVCLFFALLFTLILLIVPNLLAAILLYPPLVLLVGACIASYCNTVKVGKRIENGEFTVVLDEVHDKDVIEHRHHTQYVIVFYHHGRCTVSATDHTLADRGDRYYLVYFHVPKKQLVTFYREEAYKWMDGTPCVEGGALTSAAYSGKKAEGRKPIERGKKGGQDRHIGS